MTKSQPGIHSLQQVKDGSHVIVYKEEDDEDDCYLGPGQEKFEVSNKKHRTKMKSVASGILWALPILLVAICLGWIIIPCFVHYQISNKVVISPDANPELYSAWLHPPIPVYLKVYLFNVTNMEDIRKGALPKLQELGPFVFQENRTKEDIIHDEESDTITYKERISYHFRQELSGDLRLDDVVTIINVPFVAAIIKITYDLPFPLNSMIKTVLVGYKEPLFVQKTVEEALFQGWKVSFLEKIEEEFGVSLIPNNKFGFFIGQNDTAQGPYTVSRGTNDKSSFGIIVKFKNETELDFWGSRDSSCNKLQGTDGTIFPPFVAKSTTLRLFNAELCRSLYLTYSENTNFDGIKAYRFTAPQSVLKDPRESDENQCFCSTIEDDPDQCLKQGSLDLGPCRDGAPVAMSTPHFLDANPEYIEESGLVPDREKHETFMDIEPMTGLILNASKKIQINLILKPVKGLSSLSKVPEMLFPLVWADECASLDRENTAKFKSMLYQLWLVDFLSKWGLLALAVITLLIILSRQLRRSRHVPANGFIASRYGNADDNDDSTERFAEENGRSSHKVSGFVENGEAEREELN